MQQKLHETHIKGLQSDYGKLVLELGLEGMLLISKGGRSTFRYVAGQLCCKVCSKQFDPAMPMWSRN